MGSRKGNIQTRTALEVSHREPLKNGGDANEKCMSIGKPLRITQSGNATFVSTLSSFIDMSARIATRELVIEREKCHCNQPQTLINQP